MVDKGVLMENNIIYIILLAVLLFNLYVMLVGQRRKKMSAAEVKRQETELAKIALEEQKKHGIKFSAHNTYMNDKGKAILAAIDPKKRFLGIFFADNAQIIAYDDIDDAQQVIDEDDKYINTISVEISLKSGRTLSYPFATQKRRKKSWISQFIMRDSGGFATAIRNLNHPCSEEESDSEQKK